MEKPEGKRPVFLGAYFDRDAVLKAARLAGVVAWAILALYVFTAINSVGQYLLMMASGAVSFENTPIIDRLSVLSLPFTQMAPGLLYFSVLKVAQQALLILLEIEDTSRRAARK